MGGVIGFDAVRNGVSSITMWNMAEDENGNPTTQTNRRGVVTIAAANNGVITRSPEFNMLSHYGRAVKRGALRIYNNNFEGSLTDDIGLNCFKSPDASIAIYAFNYNLTVIRTVNVVDAVSGEFFPLTVGPCEMVSITYPARTGPALAAAPTSLARTTGSGAVNLSWSLPVTDRKVVVNRALGGGSLRPIAVLNNGTTSYVDTTGTVGQTYN